MIGKFRKGSRSKTMKGRLDFTTKKTSKMFDRGGKRKRTAQGSRIVRRPFSGKLERTRPKKKDSCGCKMFV
jgi:hypothetical protein